MMKRVFADSFFYLAVLNRADGAHQQAVAAVRAGGIEAVNTTAVLLEVADAMSAPLLRTACVRFLTALRERSDTQVLALGDDLLTRGLALYRERLDRACSLTDCLSFVVMAEEGITESLTGDRHFEQAGFVALLK
jgi:uncharacterized protein